MFDVKVVLGFQKMEGGFFISLEEHAFSNLGGNKKSNFKFKKNENLFLAIEFIYSAQSSQLYVPRTKKPWMVIKNPIFFLFK